MQLTIYSKEIINRSLFQSFTTDNISDTLYFPRQYFSTPNELLMFLNSLTVSSTMKVIFSYDMKTNRFSISFPTFGHLRMDSIICDILGFTHRNFFTGKTYIAEFSPALNRDINNLFIYSDIVESSFVGNIKTPILSVIPFEKTSGRIFSYAIINPTYVPVKRTSFNQQQIVIMDDPGARVYTI